MAVANDHPVGDQIPYIIPYMAFDGIILDEESFPKLAKSKDTQGAQSCHQFSKSRVRKPAGSL